jgi:cytoskeletal protein CcmA (bactofilin family)
MALWKETPTSTPAVPAPTAATQESGMPSVIRRPKDRVEVSESVIASNLVIEGKIEGAGNVRMAGRFKGDVRIDGTFTIDSGAHLTGQVTAGVVVVGGELQGNIAAAKRVDVLDGGVIVGDVKAGSITVAAGSRMRGHVEFGWDEEHIAKIGQSVVQGGGT